MKKSLVQIVAHNLNAAFERSGFASFRALAIAADLAPNSVRNLLKPDVRSIGPRGDAAPRLDNIEKIAHALNLEPWQIMREDFDAAHPPGHLKVAHRPARRHAVESSTRQMPLALKA